MGRAAVRRAVCQLRGGKLVSCVFCGARPCERAFRLGGDGWVDGCVATVVLGGVVKPGMSRGGGG